MQYLYDSVSYASRVWVSFNDLLTFTSRLVVLVVFHYTSSHLKMYVVLTGGFVSLAASINLGRIVQTTPMSKHPVSALFSVLSFKMFFLFITFILILSKLTVSFFLNASFFTSAPNEYLKSFTKCVF